MPAQQDVKPSDVEEMRQEYMHRRTVRYVLREMTIDQINHIFAIHSGDNDPTLIGVLAREFYLDTIDDYLDEWYPINPTRK